ncbi:MAG: hypothetical protein J6Z05_09465 [Lachnospiraceae bacterium]|nr:hypothetical protein [Lachnospiraceae bacterium]
MKQDIWNIGKYIEPDNYELMVDYSCGAERSADQILRYLDGINTGIVKKEGP